MFQHRRAKQINMHLLQVEDCRNCKTSVERICQVHVGWGCCRYLLNVRLPVLVLGLFTQFTGENKIDDVITHILPVKMKACLFLDTWILTRIIWMNKLNGRFDETKLHKQLFLKLFVAPDCLLRILRNGSAIHFWMVKILEDQPLFLSFRSWVNMFDSGC